MTVGRRQGALVIGFVVMAIAFGVALYRLGGGSLPGDRAYRVQAVVPSAVALVPGAEVREAGMTVGKVAGVAGRGTTSVLMLDLHPRQAPVFRDATVAVRLKSLVGENYVEVDPGHPAAGAVAPGGVLPLRNASPEVQLDQILSTFPAKVRRRIQVLLDGLGGGLAGRGQDLNRLFGSLSAVVESSRPTVVVLAAQRGQVAELVAHLGDVMRAIGDRGRAIRLLARQGKTAAAAVAVRDAHLAAILRRLPRTLRRLSAATDHLGRFSTHATPVLSELTSAFVGLTPAIARLRPAAHAARRAVASLGGFSRRGGPLLDTLKSFSRRATPAMPSLDEMLRQLDPLLSYLSPYASEIGAFFSNTRSATGYYDATGHLARVLGLFAPNSLPIFTPEQAKALDALVAAGALTPVARHGTNPYPAPGSLAHFVPFSGNYQRVEALPPAGRSSSP